MTNKIKMPYTLAMADDPTGNVYSWEAVEYDGGVSVRILVKGEWTDAHGQGHPQGVAIDVYMDGGSVFSPTSGNDPVLHAAVSASPRYRTDEAADRAIADRVARLTLAIGDASPPHWFRENFKQMVRDALVHTRENYEHVSRYTDADPVTDPDRGMSAAEYWRERGPEGEGEAEGDRV